MDAQLSGADAQPGQSNLMNERDQAEGTRTHDTGEKRDLPIL